MLKRLSGLSSVWKVAGSIPNRSILEQDTEPGIAADVQLALCMAAHELCVCDWVNVASVVKRSEQSADWKRAIEMQVHSGPSGPVRGATDSYVSCPSLRSRTLVNPWSVTFSVWCNHLFKVLILYKLFVAKADSEEQIHLQLIYTRRFVEAVIRSVLLILKLQVYCQPVNLFFAPLAHIV